MRSITHWLPALCVLFVAFFAFPPTHRILNGATRSAVDYFDARPVETILIIGNSRTYYNDMPDMIREMADSAHSPILYAITTYAEPGATFESNWNDAHVQKLLSQRWDHVILQAESAAHYDDSTRTSFDVFGRKLISAARAGGSPVAVIVNWAYDESIFKDLPAGARAYYEDRIQYDYRSLARNTGVKLINTGRVWEQVRSASPDLPLYTDGNHPSIQGSYLSALMIYRFISGKDIGTATFLPSGIDENGASTMKTAVSRYGAP